MFLFLLIWTNPIKLCLQRGLMIILCNHFERWWTTWLFFALNVLEYLTLWSSNSLLCRCEVIGVWPRILWFANKLKVCRTLETLSICHISLQNKNSLVFAYILLLDKYFSTNWHLFYQANINTSEIVFDKISKIKSKFFYSTNICQS